MEGTLISRLGRLIFLTMIEPTKPPQINPERRNQILDAVMPDVMEIMRQFKEELSGVLPEELSYGMVAGYLRGRGHTWEESFVAMHQWITVMKTHYSQHLHAVDGTMTIQGSGNAATIQVQNNEGTV